MPSPLKIKSVPDKISWTRLCLLCIDIHVFCRQRRPRIITWKIIQNKKIKNSNLKLKINLNNNNKVYPNPLNLALKTGFWVQKDLLNSFISVLNSFISVLNSFISVLNSFISVLNSFIYVLNSQKSFCSKKTGFEC